MPLADLQRPDGISCPKYEREAKPGSKRCRHFVKGGACALPSELLCIEWVRANPDKAAEYDQPKDPGPTLPGFDPPKPPQPKPNAPKPKSKPQVVNQLSPVSRDELPMPIADADLQSLVALGYEMLIEGWGGQPFWLVPNYTPNERPEISYRDAATLANVLYAFPGARVKQLRRVPPDPAESPPTKTGSE